MSEPKEDLGPVFSESFKAFIIMFAFALNFIGIIAGFIATFFTCMMETHVLVINIIIELALILVACMRRFGKYKNPLYYIWTTDINDNNNNENNNVL